MALLPSIRLGFADDKVKTKPEVRDCIEAVLFQSDGLIAAVFEGLRLIHAQPIEQSRGRAATLNKHPANRKALQDLLALEAAAKGSFKAELRGAFYSRRATDVVVQPILRFDDFQFLDENQIDANIETALTQQEVASAVEAALPPLNALMSTLLGMVSVQPQLNPLKPEAFVQALRGMLNEHVPNETARSVIIAASASLLGPALNNLYKEVSQWLRSQGVEPALPVGYLAGTGSQQALNKSVENPVTRTMLTLDKLRKLLSGDFESGLSALTGGPKDFLHTVPSSFVALEDLKLVEPMMQRLAARAKQSKAKAQSSKSASAPMTMEMLENDKDRQKQLGRQLGSEVVRLMLENLGKDERLLTPVRGLLKNMEPILLKLAQTDPRFFSDKKHPARVLMDRITHRSLAFASENDAGFRPFSKAISNAIQVLAGTQGDAPSFARVLRKLEDGWEREDAVQLKRHQEAARALLHAEQRNLLAHRFADELTQRSKGKNIPDNIAAFLRGPWAQVMAEAQLRSGEGGGDPGGYNALVDDLIWSVQPRLTQRDRTRLVQLVPTLLVTLRQGLQLIDYPPERLPVLFDALIELHEKAFELPEGYVPRNPTPTPTPASAPTGEPGDDQADQAVVGPSSVLDNVSDDDFWVGSEEALESGYEAADANTHIDTHPASALVPEREAEMGMWAVADLKVGAWVELMHMGAWVRAQLTWASPHLTLFMFVSGKGLAHSMSRRTMEQRRIQGLIRIVSDGDVVGSALNEVAQTALRNQPAPVTGPAPLQ